MRKAPAIMVAAIAALSLSTVTTEAGVIAASHLFTGSSFQSQSFGGDFDQFDPSLGVLDTVTISFLGQQTFTTTCDLCLFSVPYGYSVGYNFNAPGFPLTNPNTTPFYILINVGGVVDASHPSVDGPINFNTGPLDADGSALGSYIGLGTVNVAGTMSEDSDFCDAQGALCSLSNSLDLTTTLTYSFTPIPEPTTLMVFGGGLAGIGAAMRKRRSAARRIEKSN